MQTLSKLVMEEIMDLGDDAETYLILFLLKKKNPCLLNLGQDTEGARLWCVL